MKPKERQAYILEKVREKNFISINDLTSLFNVSVQSIRKDANALYNQGLVRRVHGGLEIVSKMDNISYDRRQIINYEAKKSIAKLVAKEIPHNSSIYFSIGTTPQMVAQELTNHQNLTVFTNNVNVALSLCENSSCTITLHGGVVRNKHRDILGKGMETFFSSNEVDFGIFGVGAIGEDGSLYDFTAKEVKARETIKEHSKRVFLVADSSKFTRSAYIQSGKICDANTFFCDKKPPQPLYQMLKQNGVKVVFNKGDISSCHP